MIDKRRMLAGALTAALFTTALPGLTLAQDEGEDTTYAAEGLEWVLSGYLDGESLRDIASEDPVPATVTLMLQDGTASGTAGCNQYSGSYEITEDTLTFGDDIALTMMMCEGPQADIEQAYLALLPAVAGWAVDGYTLSLSDDEGMEILRYDEAIVELRGSDLAALSEALISLDESNAALTDAVADIDSRLSAVEQNIGNVNIKGVRDRVNTLEEETDAAGQEITKLQEQQKNMGNRLGGQETRITAVEDQVAIHFENYPVPAPSPGTDPA